MSDHLDNKAKLDFRLTNWFSTKFNAIKTKRSKVVENMCAACKVKGNKNFPCFCDVTFRFR